MADNLQKLIELAKADGGKFFVLDENGSPVLVMMSVEEYEKVLVRKIQSQAANLEEINRKIAEAAAQQTGGAGLQFQDQEPMSEQDLLKSEIIDSTFSFETPNSLEEDL